MMDNIEQEIARCCGTVADKERMQQLVKELADQLADATSQCVVMADLVNRMVTMMVMAGDEAESGSLNPAKAWMFEAQEALSGKLPEQHHDDAAVDRFATAMKAKLAAAREKGRCGWEDPNACSVEFLADLLVGHVGKGNPGNFEDIANLAMMLHQRGADPAVLTGKVQVPAVPEGWQLVPVMPTPEMMLYKSECQHHSPYDLSCYMRRTREAIWRAMLAAAPKPAGKGEE